MNDSPQQPDSQPSQTSPQSDEPRDPQILLWQPDDSGTEQQEPAPAEIVKPEPVWTMGDLGMFVLFAVLTLFVSTALVTGAFLLLGRGQPSAARLETPFIVSMQVVWEVFWLAFIYRTIAGKYREPFWHALRWRRVPSTRVYFAAGIALAVVAQLVSSLFPPEEDLPIERLFSGPASAYLLTVFGICIAPFIEELVFRGFFYPVFERRWGLARAVLLTGLIFTVIHAPQLGAGLAQLLAIFLVGVVLSYVRGRTGSLVPSYLMHLAYNSTLFISLYLSTDRFRNLPV